MIPVEPKIPREQTSERRSQPSPRSSSEPEYTIADAFDYFTMSHYAEDSSDNNVFNRERCVRAVAFLLHYSSDYGNEKISGLIAEGLGHVLEKCAAHMAFAKQHLSKPREQTN